MEDITTICGRSKSKYNFTSDLFDKVGVEKIDIGINKWRRMET